MHNRPSESLPDFEVFSELAIHAPIYLEIGYLFYYFTIYCFDKWGLLKVISDNFCFISISRRMNNKHVLLVITII